MCSPSSPASTSTTRFTRAISARSFTNHLGTGVSYGPDCREIYWRRYRLYRNGWRRRRRRHHLRTLSRCRTTEPVSGAGPVRQPDFRLRGDRGARHLLAADRAAALVRALSSVGATRAALCRRVILGARNGAERRKADRIGGARPRRPARRRVSAVSEGDLRLPVALVRAGLH